MKCFLDTRDKDKRTFLEQELTEEQFLEHYAALEDGLALLQIHIRGMSEDVKRFGSLVRRMRRINLPYDSITQARSVTGATCVPPTPASPSDSCFISESRRGCNSMDCGPKAIESLSPISLQIAPL